MNPMAAFPAAFAFFLSAFDCLAWYVFPPYCSSSSMVRRNFSSVTVRGIIATLWMYPKS